MPLCRKPALDPVSQFDLADRIANAVLEELNGKTITDQVLSDVSRVVKKVLDEPNTSEESNYECLHCEGKNGDHETWCSLYR